jgi:hypothetical protein
VIDAFCLQPIDGATIAACTRDSQGLILTVEDHYLHGGLGDCVSRALAPYGIAVQRLGVDAIPRSGQPEQLMDHFHITASGAYFLAGSPASTRLIFRASNPPFQGRKVRIGSFLAWLYGLRFRGARRIISVSEELRLFLVKNIHFNPQQVVTIANSVDLKFAREQAGQAGAPVVCAW